jgi:hypothetical protein
MATEIGSYHYKWLQTDMDDINRSMPLIAIPNLLTVYAHSQSSN